MNPAAFQPDYAVPPGETLADWMAMHNVTVLDMCDLMVAMPPFVNALLAGEQEITDGMAHQLESVTGIVFSFWIERERKYREQLAKSKEGEA